MVHDCNIMFLLMYIDYRRSYDDYRNRYITRLTDLHLAYQRFNDPRMEFKSFATGLNESINPVINALHLYRLQSGQVQHRGILIVSYISVCDRDIRHLKKRSLSSRRKQMIVF